MLFDIYVGKNTSIYQMLINSSEYFDATIVKNETVLRNILFNNEFLRRRFKLQDELHLSSLSFLEAPRKSQSHWCQYFS
jgi:hypothetical protein